jgi:hypothetical protein
MATTLLPSSLSPAAGTASDPIVTEASEGEGMLVRVRVEEEWAGDQRGL